MARYDYSYLGPFRDGISASHDLTQAGAICISFPKGLIPHIIGALDDLKYPDAWIGTPEEIKRSILQVQTFLAELTAIASTPANPNLPLAPNMFVSLCPDCNPCPECPECPQYTDCGAVGGGSEELENEDDDMPGIKGLHWEAGKLWIDWDACCKEEVKQRWPVSAGEGGGGGYETGDGSVPDIADETGDLVDPTDHGWTPPPDTADLTCRKAWALGHAINLLFTSVVEAAQMNYISGINHVMDAVPPLNVTTLQAFNGVVPVTNSAIISRWLMHPVWGEYVEEQLVCKLADKLVPDTLAMTEPEWDIVSNAWRDLCDWETEILLGNIYAQIKKSQWRNAIAYYAMDDSANCDCPNVGVSTEPTIPVAHEWMHIIDFQVDQQGFYPAANSVLQYSYSRKGWHTTMSGHEYQYTGIERSNVGSGAGTVVYCRHEFSDVPESGRLWWPELLTIGANGYLTLVDTSLMPPYRTAIEFVMQGAAYSAGQTWKFQYGQIQKIDGVFSGELTVKRVILAGNGVNPFE